jgi:asparagine N-glycosylation enzyme membrane subunit Stt3
MKKKIVFVCYNNQRKTTMAKGRDIRPILGLIVVFGATVGFAVLLEPHIGLVGAVLCGFIISLVIVALVAGLLQATYNYFKCRKFDPFVVC